MTVCAVCERTKADHDGLAHKYTEAAVRIIPIPRCTECGSGGRHRASCPKAVLCAECGGSGGHKAMCPKAVLCAECGSGGRHRASCPKAVLCAECGGSGGHKAMCPKAVLCANCWSVSKHRASCARNTKPLKRPYCGMCGNLIRSDAHREKCEGKEPTPIRGAR